MARRSKAREIALQMLYQGDLNPDISADAVRAMVDDRIDELIVRKVESRIEEYRGEVVDQTLTERFRDEARGEFLPLREFAWQLFVGVMEFRAMLDERIQSVAENWTLHRMAPTDRNVLRLGTFELLHTDTPLKVVIDEAIELARKFGTAHSAQFVNGILDQLVPEEKREAAE